MTRALKIVNLSNWDGEDYIIQAPLDMLPSTGTRVLHPEEHKLGAVTLAPGESVNVSAYDEKAMRTITVISVQREIDGERIDKPFEMNGKQVLPFMETGFR